MKECTKILLIFTIEVLLFGCKLPSSEKLKRDRKEDIAFYINHDTGLEIDTNFRILTDSIQQIDWQDYSVYYTIEFNLTQELKIIEQIENSRYFNQESVTYKSANFWNQLVQDSLKGYWYSIDMGYRFEDVPLFEGYIDSKKKSYSIDMEVDTLNNVLIYEFHQI